MPKGSMHEILWEENQRVELQIHMGGSVDPYNTRSSH
jgi:hypothetical protein